MLLAIDTSNDWAGVALWSEHGFGGEATWRAGRQHTEQLLPQIDLLLRHVGAGAEALTVAVVATGPGSWSGLRAGMSLAKALAVGRDLPLIGIPTLDALAYGQRAVGRRVLAVIRLGRDRYGAAVYDTDVERVERIGPFLALGSSEVTELAHDTVPVGDLPAGMPGAALATEAEHQRRAVHIAALGWARHLRGDYADRVGLEPIYLGSPVRG